VSQPVDVHAARIDRLERPMVDPCDWLDAVRLERTRVLESTIGLVENLQCGGRHRRSPESFSPCFQVCLPYRGLFVWHVGQDEVVGDANQVLFVTRGENFHLSQPRPVDYAELIITPHLHTLADLASASETRLPFHPLFRRRSRRAGTALQRLRARFLHEAIGDNRDELAAEELMMSLLRSALEAGTEGCEPSRPTRSLIGRTKEFLEAHLSSPIRLHHVARAVGASPTYLTDVFRRVEGVPLHRYLVQLRLARALIELPHADDLTTLALALGFSNHSHFTTAFRRAFGSTPSQYRETTRAPRGPTSKSLRRDRKDQREQLRMA
jgi:AraC family transcriptional regulator